MIVVHSGARDRYLLTKSLQDLNRDPLLVTDDLLFRSEKNEFNYKICYKALFYKLINKLLKSHNLNLFKDIALSEHAYKVSKSTNASIFAYSYYAFEAFKKKSIANKYLFQLHPHPYYLREIFIEERNINPEWSQSLLKEQELNYKKSYLDRLAKEPKLADKILVTSTFTKKTLTENGVNESKIEVAPYPIEFNSFKNNNILNDKCEQNNKLLFVGSLTQRKGIYYLLEAYRKLKEEGYELTIITRGIFDKKVYSYALEIGVKVLRDVNKDILIKYYKQSNIFILPSLAEGFGHVIAEALSFGLPVITTQNTIGGDIISNGYNGYLIPLRDVNAIIQSVDLIKDQYESMSKNCFDIKKKFTYQHFIESINHFVS